MRPAAGRASNGHEQRGRAALYTGRGHASSPRAHSASPSTLEAILGAKSGASPALLINTADLIVSLASGLTTLIGTDGYRALLACALQLAAAEFPMLRGVVVARGRGWFSLWRTPRGHARST